MEIRSACRKSTQNRAFAAVEVAAQPLIALGAKAPAGLLQNVIVDGATAFVVVLAMAFGLIIPKLCIDRLRHADAA